MHAEHPRGLDTSRHLRPDAILERVERLPERGVVVGSGTAVVQHRTPQLSTCAGTTVPFIEHDPLHEVTRLRRARWMFVWSLLWVDCHLSKEAGLGASGATR